MTSASSRSIPRFASWHACGRTCRRTPATLHRRMTPKVPNNGETDPESSEWKKLAAARGIETRLGPALARVLHDDPDTPLAAVVLLTDGRQNIGPPPDAAVRLARDRGVPILPIGIGSTDPPANLRVADLAVPSRAYPGDPFDITGYIQGSNFGGKTVTVDLLMRETSGDAKPGERHNRRKSGDHPSGIRRNRPGPLRSGSRRDRVAGPSASASSPPRRTGTRPTTPKRRTSKSSTRKQKSSFSPAAPRVSTVSCEPCSTAIRVSRSTSCCRAPFRGFLRKRTTSSTASRPTTEGDVRVRLRRRVRSGLAGTGPRAQMELFEDFIGRQGGGAILIAGAVHAGNPVGGWTQDDSTKTIRNLYPVEFERRFTTVDFSVEASEEPWPLEFTREVDARPSSSGWPIRWDEERGRLERVPRRLRLLRDRRSQTGRYRLRPPSPIPARPTARNCPSISPVSSSAPAASSSWEAAKCGGSASSTRRSSKRSIPN